MEATRGVVHNTSEHVAHGLSADICLSKNPPLSFFFLSLFPLQEAMGGGGEGEILNKMIAAAGGQFTAPKYCFSYKALCILTYL